MSPRARANPDHPPGGPFFNHDSKSRAGLTQCIPAPGAGGPRERQAKPAQGLRPSSTDSGCDSPVPAPQPLSSPTVGLRAQESSSLDKYPPPDMRPEAAPPRPCGPYPLPPPSPHPNPPWSFGRGQRPVCWPGWGWGIVIRKSCCPRAPGLVNPRTAGPSASAGQLWPTGITARAQGPGSQAAWRRHLHPLLGPQPTRPGESG